MSDKDSFQQTVDADEIAKFSAMAEEWWDPHGKFRPLHKFNQHGWTILKPKPAPILRASLMIWNRWLA